MDVKREGESYSQCCTLELLEGSVFVAAFMQPLCLQVITCFVGHGLNFSPSGRMIVRFPRALTNTGSRHKEIFGQ